ncbi:MAG: EamA family transporter [Gammaproteobacteria bacterium]|nr:EamA family transporter [Gammaproteobacteria bacterium]
MHAQDNRPYWMLRHPGRLQGVFSLPLFWLWAVYSAGFRAIVRVDAKGLTASLIAGFACYYVGGSIDFYALTLIDAGLERVLLYTYPTIIVLSLALLNKRWPSWQVIFSLLITYLGILLAIGAFDMSLWRANAFGSFLVLLCAVTYAGYFFANDIAGKRIGSAVFTVYAMSAATLALLIHFSLTHSFNEVTITPRAWTLLTILVVFVTVVPLFLMAEGVKQIGAQRAGLVSTVGPASTIILAAIILGEKMLWFQYLGVLITLFGIMFVEWKQKQIGPVAD